MERIYKELGKKVRKYRKKKSLTSLELAERLNVSIGHISNIENGKNDIFKLELLFNLTKELDITVEELLNITSLSLGDIVLNPEKIVVNLVKPMDTDNKNILVVDYYLKVLINNYLDAINHYHFQEESVEAITSHLIDELSFVNKLNKFRKISPIA